MQIILCFLIISTKTEPNKDVFPEDLVPAISKVLAPSIKNDNNPAAKSVIIPVLINNGKVHGLSLCLLIANAVPVAFKGLVIIATLALAPGIDNCVSKTGIASSNGLAEINLNLDAQDSISSADG